MARSYSSSLGRFQSPDPEEGDPSNPQTWNRYAYVGNDVINVTDPSGKDWLTDLVIGAMIFADLIDGGLSGVFAGIGQSTGIPVFNAEDEGCNFSSGCSGNTASASLVFNGPLSASSDGGAAAYDPQAGGQSGATGKVYPPSFIGPLQLGDVKGPFIANLHSPKTSFLFDAPINGNYPAASHHWGFSDECVSLTRSLTTLPNSTLWRKGPSVVGNNTQRGTAIATFNRNGLYPQQGQHFNSGIYAGPGSVPGSILIIDQWKALPATPGYQGRPAKFPSIREVAPHNPRSASDSADAYSVIYATPWW